MNAIRRYRMTGSDSEPDGVENVRLVSKEDSTPPVLYIHNIDMEYDEATDQSFPYCVTVLVSGARGPEAEWVDTQVQLWYQDDSYPDAYPRRLTDVMFDHDTAAAEELEPTILAFVVRHLRGLGFGGELPPIDWDAAYQVYAEI